MDEIRRVNSDALLIQTEDLGKIFSTARLGYQAEFENERRWLSFDLLCGRVQRHHPLWTYLLDAGIEEREILWFSDNPCPPDIFGINHYVTSDRYLDERLDFYPCTAHGGNGLERYADVEAVRVDLDLPLGVGRRILEAWQRYRSPLAITEVHLGSNQEEQLLWFYDNWNAAGGLERNGVDLRAVTAWSLFGAYDWHCLLTREENRYECGVFDIRHPMPHRTLLANWLREIGNGNADATLPFAGWKVGWWRSSERIQYTIGNTKDLNSPAVCLDLC
jgi:dTDP-4-dehydrorhamnose reductase